MFAIRHMEIGNFLVIKESQKKVCFTRSTFGGSDMLASVYEFERDLVVPLPKNTLVDHHFVPTPEQIALVAGHIAGGS